MLSSLSALGLLMVPATALGDLGVREHEFVFTSSIPLKSVTVAGTFNGWNKTADRLVADADGRTWRLRRDLPFGVIQYKFVLNDQNWVIDPNAVRQFDDGAGNTNSVLVHRPADYARASRFGDGQITRSPWVTSHASPSSITIAATSPSRSESDPKMWIRWKSSSTERLFRWPEYRRMI